MSTTPDRIAIALASIGGGATIGAAIVTTVLVSLRAFQLQSNPQWDAGLLLVVAVFVGIVTAGAVAWFLARRVDDTWRRGVTAALGVFGACMLAALSAPADALGGRTGLMSYLLLLVVGAVYAVRQARRAERGETLSAGT